MLEAGINWMESTDLSGILHLVHEYKRFLKVQVKSTNREELIDGIEHFGDTKVNVESRSRNTNHLQRGLRGVVQRNGRATAV